MSIPKTAADAGRFLSDLARKWGALVSGAFSVPFTIAGFLTHSSYQITIWWSMAAAAVLFSYFLDHKKQKARIVELEDRLSPKIHLFLHRDSARGTAGIEVAKDSNGEDIPYIQVSCEALTDALIHDCIPSIVRIEHRGDSEKEFKEVWGESRAIHFTWRHTTLSKGNPLRFNILAYDPRGPGLADVAPPDKQSNMLHQFYSSTGRTGEYRYTVHVAGQDVRPCMAYLSVRWGVCGYPDVTLEEIKPHEKGKV